MNDSLGYMILDALPLVKRLSCTMAAMAALIVAVFFTLWWIALAGMVLM